MVARYFSGSVGGHVVMTRGPGYRSDCTLRLSRVSFTPKAGRKNPIVASIRRRTKSSRLAALRPASRSCCRLRGECGGKVEN